MVRHLKISLTGAILAYKMEEKRKAGLTMITEENGVFHIRTETDSYLFKSICISARR